MEFSCEQIGLTQQELQDRIIDGVVDRMLSKYVTYSDEYGRDCDDIENSQLRDRLDKAIKTHIDKEIDRVANAYLEPLVTNLVEKFKLQETTRWGEPKGEEMSLTEYIATRAEKYMAEPVDFNGNARSEVGRHGSFTQRSTRMVYAIEKYLHYHMEQAMKKALGNAHKTLNDSIMATVQASLSEVTKAVKLNVSIK